MDPGPSVGTDTLEREKWEAERAFRERELALRERDHARGRWTTPVVVAILAAAVAATGNAVVAYTNHRAETWLEAQKAEQARILEVVKTGDPDKAAVNLQFLLRAGLIEDASTRAHLAGYLAGRKHGSGPALPTDGGFRVVGKNGTATARG